MKGKADRKNVSKKGETEEKGGVRWVDISGLKDKLMGFETEAKEVEEKVVEQPKEPAAEVRDVGQIYGFGLDLVKAMLKRQGKIPIGAISDNRKGVQLWAPLP